MSQRRKPPARVSAFLPADRTAPRPAGPGPAGAFLRYGFRPFFLAAAIWAIVSVTPWVPFGDEWLAAGYTRAAWHAHESLFGFTAAALAGFVLTAIPNWTGRKPLTGLRLAALLTFWCAGRLAFLVPYPADPIVAAAIDGAFLPVIVGLAARDIIAGRNWRNLKTFVLLGLFASAGIGFHYRILAGHSPEPALRLAIAALIGLIMVIGGRMAMNFTLQWLQGRNDTALPAPFGRLDRMALAAGGCALLAWTVRPEGSTTAVLLVVAGLLQALRLSRWRGLAARCEPMLLILHVAYGFIALGFLLTGLALIAPGALAPPAALHAWTTGAIGTMILGVMTRAARGHAGLAFHASRMTTLSYGAIILAALLRIGAGFLPAASFAMTTAAAMCWAVGFSLYLVEYAAMLMPRRTSA